MVLTAGICLFGLFFWGGVSYLLCLGARDIFLDAWNNTGPIIETIMLFIVAGMSSVMSLTLAILVLVLICHFTLECRDYIREKWRYYNFSKRLLPQ